MNYTQSILVPIGCILFSSCEKESSEKIEFFQDVKSGSQAAQKEGGDMEVFYEDPLYDPGSARWERGIDDGWPTALSEGDSIYVNRGELIFEITLLKISRDPKFIIANIVDEAHGEGREEEIKDGSIEVGGVSVKWSLKGSDQVFIYFDDLFDGTVDYRLGEKVEDGVKLYRHKYARGVIKK